MHSVMTAGLSAQGAQESQRDRQHADKNNQIQQDDHLNEKRPGGQC